MSADNQMIIRPYYGKWCVYMEMGNTPYILKEARKVHDFQIFNTQLEAIQYANKICEEEYVEYGICVRG